MKRGHRFFPLKNESKLRCFLTYMMFLIILFELEIVQFFVKSRIYIRLRSNETIFYLLYRGTLQRNDVDDDPLTWNLFLVFSPFSISFIVYICMTFILSFIYARCNRLRRTN